MEPLDSVDANGLEAKAERDRRLRLGLEDSENAEDSTESYTSDDDVPPSGPAAMTSTGSEESGSRRVDDPGIVVRVSDTGTLCSALTGQARRIRNG